MGRLRNSKGQFISKQAEEAIRQISEEHGVKDAQTYFQQNEKSFKGLFSATFEAKFSTNNAADYLNRNFDKFAVSNGEKEYSISRYKLIELIAKFQNYINFHGANTAVFTGEMRDKDKDGAFHKIVVNMPIVKEGNTFSFSLEKLEEMEENGDIELFKSEPKSKEKNKPIKAAKKIKIVRKTSKK